MPIPRWIRARDDHAARSLSENLFEMSHIFKTPLSAGKVEDRQSTGPSSAPDARELYLSEQFF
jgi:hypothetical protein